MRHGNTPELPNADQSIVRFRVHMQNNFRVTDREWEVMRDRVQTQRIRKGTFFVREGTICRHLGLIIEGVMRYLRFEENGLETTCYLVSENEFVGDPESFASQKPSDKNLHAITDCVLGTISYEAWQRLVQEMPRFQEIAAEIGRKTLMDLLTQRDFLLTRDAASRYEYFIKQYPRMLQRTPLGYIASYLGITQQSLSRLRKQLSPTVPRQPR